MAPDQGSFVDGLVVEEEIRLTLVELCQACQAPEPEIRALVVEGVLEPTGALPRSGASPAPRCGEPAPRCGCRGISR
jgi:hypothetical protein